MTSDNHPFVAILMGSDSDLNTMKPCMNILQQFNIQFEARISSAHPSPGQTHAYVKDADARGCAVFIAAAGLVAHLAGAVAANTCKPVIGVPVASDSLQGCDALLSTFQRPVRPRCHHVHRQIRR